MDEGGSARLVACRCRVQARLPCRSGQGWHRSCLIPSRGIHDTSLSSEYLLLLQSITESQSINGKIIGITNCGRNTARLDVHHPQVHAISDQREKAVSCLLAFPVSTLYRRKTCTVHPPSHPTLDGKDLLRQVTVFPDPIPASLFERLHSRAGATKPPR